MNVSTWSIRNPIPAVLLFLMLTLLGLMAFRGMKIQQFPDIDLPTVTVTASLPGAAPAQMETEVGRKIENAVHTRFPVVKGGLHEVLGMISAKQLLTQTIRGEKPVLTDNMQPPVFVPESLTGMELLDNFRSTSMQSALVIDEYGEIQGLVTLRDVLEAITGEFKPRNVEDAWAIQRADGSWLLDGLIPVPELKDRLGLRQVPEEDKGRYNALSGMLMLLLGRVPQTTDVAEWEGWRFEVVDMDGKRVDKVLASTLAEADVAPAQANEGST